MAKMFNLDISRTTSPIYKVKCSIESETPLLYPCLIQTVPFRSLEMAKIDIFCQKRGNCSIQSFETFGVIELVSSLSYPIELFLLQIHEFYTCKKFYRQILQESG